MSALFDHLWQSTVFAGALGVLTLAFRRDRAAVRYGLWFAASLKFLLPFSALLALGGFLFQRLAPEYRRRRCSIRWPRPRSPYRTRIWRPSCRRCRN